MYSVNTSDLIQYFLIPYQKAQQEASTSIVGKDCERRFDVNAAVEHITMLSENIGDVDDNNDDDMGLPLDDFTGNDDEDDSPPGKEQPL